MIDLDRMICICNSLDVRDIAICVNKHGFESVEAMIQNSDCPMGDKCESCVEDGYENDGYSLAMVLALAKEGRLGI